MTQDERYLEADRMRFTKDKQSANFVLLAIVMDVLYFVSIYQSDVSKWYYNWMIGVSIIVNLLFMLTSFLASEGVKNRKSGFTGILLGLGLLQLLRTTFLPAKAHAATVTIKGAEMAVMGDSQYFFCIACLVLSAAACAVAAYTSSKNNKRLADHMKSLEAKSV